MILLDSTEFKRILHIAKFFAMLGIYIETTKFFQKNEKKQGLFRPMAYSVPDQFLFSREKSLHSLPFPVEN